MRIQPPTGIHPGQLCLSLILCVFTLLLSFACPSEAKSADSIAAISASDREQIEILFSQVYTNSIRNKNLDSYLSLYTEDALWSPPDAPTRMGLDGITVGFEALVDGKDISPESRATEIEIKDDFAYVVGDFIAQIRLTDGREQEMTQHYQAIWLLRKQGEQWKVSHQLWNTKPGKT